MTSSFSMKVALYEHLAAFSGGRPNPHHFRLYSEWAKHDWGMVLTGNVQVTPDHLTLGRDIVLPPDLNNPKEEDLLPFRQLAHAMHGGNLRPESKEHKILAIMQLSHAGRQSSNFIGGRPVFRRPSAPSPIQVGLGSWRKANLIEGILNNALFQTPKEMTEEDILNVVVRFVYGAVFAQKAGFDGIQLHAAHGCRSKAHANQYICSLIPLQIYLHSSFLPRQTKEQMLIRVTRLSTLFIPS